MKIQLKRVYEAPQESDGVRILVDRLWPRGITKEAAQIDLWAKEIAPSNELRKWYEHDPKKWAEFKRRYYAELESSDAPLDVVRKHVEAGPVTLVFSSRETELNNAAALKELLLRSQ